MENLTETKIVFRKIKEFYSGFIDKMEFEHFQKFIKNINFLNKLVELLNQEDYDNFNQDNDIFIHYSYNVISQFIKKHNSNIIIKDLHLYWVSYCSRFTTYRLRNDQDCDLPSDFSDFSYEDV